MTGLIILTILIALMITGMPVSISLGLTVLSFLFLFTDINTQTVALKLFTGIEKFEIMAIPFFILAGNFLTHGGVAKRLIAFATSLVGHCYGGLGLAGVVACAIFAAISGSSPATVVAIGSILIPAMIKAGYPQRFGAGVITTSGALGILIPPSIVMVMYCVATTGMPNSPSISQMFIAGVVPGLFLAFLLGVTTFYRAWKYKYPRVQLYPHRNFWHASALVVAGLIVSVAFTLLPPYLIVYVFDLFAPVSKTLGTLFTFIFFYGGWLVVANKLVRQKKLTFGLRDEALNVWKSYWDSIWGLMLIVVVMGGLYMKPALFTPTEAAAVSAVYAFIVAMFVYRDMPLSHLKKILIDSANMSAMLLYIITNAALFSYLLTNEQIPSAIAEWMLGNGLGVISFLLVVNVLLLAAGNFMEPSSIVLIMVPILFPIAMKLGIDPVHFGILIVVNMEVGLCHPPVGLNLYVASGIAKMGITELTIAVWPWLLTMLFTLLVVTYLPGLSLWLPKFLGLVSPTTSMWLP